MLLYLAKIYPQNIYGEDGEYLGVDSSISEIKLISVTIPQPTDVVQLQRIDVCLQEYFMFGNVECDIYCDGDVIRKHDENGDILYELNPVFDDGIIPFA